MVCPFENVAVYGLGLIGGSLVKAFGRIKAPPFIHAIDANAVSLENAKAQGVISSFSQKPGAALLEADVIFFCVPANETIGAVESARPFAREGCLLTDTAGVKSPVCAYAEAEGLNFIGGHPLAGSERSGFLASRDFLFENAYYILTPVKSAKESGLKKLEAALSGISAVPLVMGAREHDDCAAIISHAPHIIACALVNAAAAQTDKTETLKALAAGGFKDLTRIASSDPAMWSAICSLNKSNINTYLTLFINALSDFLTALDAAGDTTGFFENAKRFRDSLTSPNGGAYLNEHRLYVDVRDTPGAIAKVAALCAEGGVNIKNINIENNRERENGVMQIVFETKNTKEAAMRLLIKHNYSVTGS